MPHMPNYKCTPPKGGGGRALYICLLIILAVIAVKVGGFIAEYLTWFLVGIGVIATAVTAKLGYSVIRALQTRTWKMDDASVMSKHDANQIYYGGHFPRHPLDGGPYIQGEVLEVDINSAYPKELTGDAQSTDPQSDRERVARLQRREASKRRGSQRGGTTRNGESGWPQKRP